MENTALTSDALYKSFDGVVKKAKTYGHVVDAGGAAVSRAVFNSALKALPRKYKQRRADLRFLAGSKPNPGLSYMLTALEQTTQFHRISLQA
jgi:hypothetical protein